MNTHSVYFGFVFTAAIIVGQCVLQAISTNSSQSGDSLNHNFIGFASAPDKVLDGAVVRLHYRCSRPCQLAVEVVASTLRKTDLVLFRRKWISNRPQAIRIHQVLLRFPPSILYQCNFFNRRVLEAKNVMLRAWLEHLHDGFEHSTNPRSMIISKELQTLPHSERPTKPPTECPSWDAQLIWQVNRKKVCRHESDKIDLLKFPLASTGEHFGVVRRFQPFIDRDLEQARLHAVTQPRVTFSVWIYLVKWCHKKLCGIIHHVDGKNAYDSILMQLSDTGNVIIQTRVTTGEDEAFSTSLVLPLWKWIRLDCYIEDSKVLLDISWNDQTHRSIYEFQHNIHYDDSDGYFVIGGGKYLPGIHGYFGPVKYYRFGTEEVDNELHPRAMLQDLDETHCECQKIKEFTTAFLQEVTESDLLSPINKGFCIPHFIRLQRQFDKKICRQMWPWETQLKYKTLFNLLQTKEEELRTGSLSMKNLRNTLFEEAVGAMFTEYQVEIKVTSKSTALLGVSSCFGNHKASLLLATIHLSGLGHSVDQHQGHIYSLIGALGDNRFALMHVAYKHTQGIDGFPKDFDMAYCYYSNAGAQSNLDSSRMHESKVRLLRLVEKTGSDTPGLISVSDNERQEIKEPPEVQEQYKPEHIYLSNKEDLKSVTYDSSDFVEYLKFEAERGDIESQKRLGTILYWGQNGASKDVASAVKWFERSAMQMRDPSAMYDYSVLLMKGQGVKRNYTRCFQLLEKAAAMGSINALNGLGWYHGIILNDHKTAVKYFEQAALNGSDDALFNLGIYHLNGKNPKSPQKNETAAFQHFLNASMLGHVAATVEAAWYLSTGSLEGVSQDVERAVIMLKKVCEQNGHLGFMIREALQAYLQGSWQEAFVKYVLAAETGLGLAQNNIAFLCEELNLSYDCQWRYHNYSILNYDPHPLALLKMGDYYYYSSSTQEDSLSLVGQAISMYSRAALAGSPQGMFNLVVLAQQGHRLPLRMQSFFNVSHHDEMDAVVEKILKRCVKNEDEEAVTPCALALLRVQMGKALRKMTQNGAQLLLAYASLLSVCVIIAYVPLKICFEQWASYGRAVTLRARTSSVSQDGINMNRAQNGIMGGTYRAAGNLWITIQNGEHWLGQTCDLALTLSGMCVCAFWTTLLYHLI